MADWDAYRAATGLDTSSPAPSDPLFAGAPTVFDASADASGFRLQKGSAAIAAGDDSVLEQFGADGGGVTDLLGSMLAAPLNLGATQ